MPELKKEQKEDLKNWEKKQRISLSVFVVLFFIIVPVLILVFDIDLHNLFGIYWFVGPITSGTLIIILIAVLIKIHYGKRCPDCGSKIAGKDIFGGETILTFSLPEKCNKCGIKFK
jgi:hypothetical protein